MIKNKNKITLDPLNKFYVKIAEMNPRTILHLASVADSPVNDCSQTIGICGILLKGV